MDISLEPLTPDRWVDFEQLFGTRGACGGCWCMFWKLRGRAFSENTGEPNRQMQHSYVHSGAVPGMLAYLDGEPVGWIAVEPRSAYSKLAFSRILKPVDTEDVWSVTCFFIARKARRQGLTVELLKGAIEFVQKQGGRIIEGYPVDTREDLPAPFAYTGLASAFRSAGFQEVARRSEKRPIFRRMID